jgi:tRNA(Ile)-lysidine synthase
MTELLDSTRTERALDRVTIERALKKAGDGPIVIGLSGGGDSTALLHLLVEEIGPARLRALVVDHALRAGSAFDAERARAFAGGLGVVSEVLTLTWPEGPRRAQQAARRARYAVLCDATRRAGARVIALGHNSDDQAETVLMRAASGSGWRGLAAMSPTAPAPVWPEGRGITLVRPLLGARRTELREYLQARGAPWLEDPANANFAFERVRVRARLAALEAAGFDPMRLVRLATRLRPFLERLDREAAALIAHATQIEGERIFVKRGAWRGDTEVRRRALGVLLMAAAGAERAPEQAALGRLETRFASDSFRGAALAGARVSRRDDALIICRDAGALHGRSGSVKRAEPMSLPASKETIWDGRLSLIAAAPGWRVELNRRGEPCFRKGENSLALAEAAAQVHTSWLLETHVQHMVGLD